MLTTPRKKIGRLIAALMMGLMALTLAGGNNASAAGLLSPADGSAPALTLKDHRVSVVIENGFAITTVDQVFQNPHQQSYEALYSFPIPEKAAVAEFTYWIDGKPVTGEVLPREKARDIYEQEKAAGNQTALTEQDGFKTFEISVYPVAPGQDTVIRLIYIQPVAIDTSIGRYVYPLEEGGVDEQKLSFWTTNDVVAGHFSFDLTLKSGYPVADLRLPSSGGAISKISDDTWTVHMDNGVMPVAGLDVLEDFAEEGAAEAPPVIGGTVTHLDQDVVVYWRLADNLPGAVVLVSYKEEGAAQGTYMMTLTPGDDLAPITEGRDFVYILDKSGSMQGKFGTMTAGVTKALNEMSPNDRYRIIMFDVAAYELTSGNTPATPENTQRTISQLRSVVPGNGTNLYDGLQLGLNRLDDDRSTGIILVTDGVANVGYTQQKDFLDLVRKNDVRLFTMIMGNSANRPLLEAISTRSGGVALSVSNSDDIIGAVLTARSKITHQALHDISVEVNGTRVYDVENGGARSLYRGQQLILFGHYEGGGAAEVVLKGKISGEPKEYRTTFNFPAVDERNPEIERLWAFSAIDQMLFEMEDFGTNPDLEQAVTDLAVQYGLVTEYTSMIVVREEMFDKYGIDRNNRDRLETEHNAQTQRSTAQPQSTRVDQQQPMYTSNRSSHSSGGGGSGAIDWVTLLFIFASLGAITLIMKPKWARD